MIASYRLTTILRIVAVVLGIAVLGLAGFFGYRVYVDRQAAVQATPALRVVAAYEDVVRSQPGVAAYRVRLGEAYAAAGMYPKAVEQLNAALQIDENHTGAYLVLGMVASINDHPTEAVNYYKKIIEITDGAEMRNTDARREQAFFNLGKMALDDEEFEQAIGYLKEAARIRKDASDTYLLLARAFQSLDDLESATKYIEYSLAFDPNFAQANYTAGEIYLAKDDKLKASEHIRRAIDSAPDEEAPRALLEELGTAQSWVKKAQAALKTDAEEALTSIKIARRIDPASVESALLHGEILEKMGKRKAALETYEEALALDASSAEAESAVSRLKSEGSASQDQ